MQTTLFWAITRRVLVISYRRFGTTYRVPSSKATYRSHLQGSGPWKWNPIRVSRNIGQQYRNPLRDNPEEPIYHVQSSLCLASPNLFVRPRIFLPFHPVLIMQLSWQNGCLWSKATSIIHVLIRARGLYMWSLSLYIYIYIRSVEKQTMTSSIACRIKNVSRGETRLYSESPQRFPSS